MSRHWWIGIVVGIILVGCNLNRDPSNAWHVDDAFITKLQHVAASIAEREIAAMQAAEMAYRDTVATFSIRHPIIPVASHSFKWYREYKDFGLVDIYRSDSLLEPIIIEIDYEFDYMRTPIRASFHYRQAQPEKAAQAAAAKDDDYTVEGTGYIVRRRYQTDAHGNVVNKFEPLANRALHPEMGNDLITEGYSPRDLFEGGGSTSTPPQQGFNPRPGLPNSGLGGK